MYGKLYENTVIDITKHEKGVMFLTLKFLFLFLGQILLLFMVKF
jgi:hypothetical protein